MKAGGGRGGAGSDEGLVVCASTQDPGWSWCQDVSSLASLKL